MNSKQLITTTVLTAATTLSLAMMPRSTRAADSQMEWRLAHPAADFSPGLGRSRSTGDQETFFLGAGAGVALMQDLTLKNTGGAKMSFDPGARFDLSLGYRLTTALNADFQTGFLYNSVNRIAGVSLSDVGASAEFYQIPLLVGVNYTIPIHGPIKGFLGADIGGVIGRFNATSPGGNIEHTDFTFGYQGTAGIKYEFNDRIDLGLAYKFLGTTDHSFGSGTRSDGTMAHCILICFQMKL
jgi:opacity protein-like surface antigen